MNTKQDIINRIHEGSDISKKTIEQVVNWFVAEVVDDLVAGNEVRIHGLGTFRTTTRKAHKGRNPQTGEVIEIPEKRVPQLSFSSQIRREMNS